MAAKISGSGGNSIWHRRGESASENENGVMVNGISNGGIMAASSAKAVIARNNIEIWWHGGENIEALASWR